MLTILEGPYEISRWRDRICLRLGRFKLDYFAILRRWKT